ncbi:succinate dehydrogenase / fumarate reductase flavoprotein subunit [Methanohalophilus levihalophilus]|uniref:FAD-dependent oxidoreductase n=1 Tax=Methanohalophilus levihalophilus TaxID=1431282 RepID=UPI001AE98144|nr:FAD-dependent oxidoreductase [Methanohalophilus levihalophilus]MBP2029497.1 succinate dehydrogenase / fumarate reductase flavoprotein subunit [Methanohalophilus levihalophilus]
MIEHEIIVIGGGLAGLRAALEAKKKGADVAVISKVPPIRSHSVAAQGGINAAIGSDDSWENHAYDTVKGSDYLADQDTVEILCKEAPERVYEMENWGVLFSRTEDGKIAQRPFGGAGFPRTCYAGDKTGHNLLHTLYEQILWAGIKIYNEWMVTNLALEDRKCTGFVAINLFNSELEAFRVKATILATGGYGRIYQRSTNSIINTGFGISLAYKAGVPMQDMEFVQFHPTTLWGTNILITEGVRGEGGYLYNKDHERFMEKYASNSMELAPRDIVARSIQTEIDEGRGFPGGYVHLDITHLDTDLINDRLSGIRQICIDFAGVDPVKEPIPVQPGHHYSMGGIPSGKDGMTPMDGLYAIGECACISVHGANRLGGNSLLDTIVFGKRAGEHAADYVKKREMPAQDSLNEALEEKKAELDSLMGEGGESFADVKDELRETMQKYVGVYRNRKDLETGLEKIKELEKRGENIRVKSKVKTFNLELMNAIEVKGMLELARVITEGALVREESRGAHYRTDFLERDDENWLKHTLAYRTPQGPRLEYKEVTITRFQPKRREY